MSEQEIVQEKLENIKNGVKDFDYEIYTDFSNFKNIVKLGKTYRERLQLLIMCYYYEPKLEELKNLTLEQVLDYIKETDEQYRQDEKYVIECINLIKELED